MKKLLVVSLVLGSLSGFANDCTFNGKNLSDSTKLIMQEKGYDFNESNASYTLEITGGAMNQRSLLGGGFDIQGPRSYIRSYLKLEKNGSVIFESSESRRMPIFAKLRGEERLIKKNWKKQTEKLLNDVPNCI